MKVLVVDNYDSFTYNLVQYLGELGAEMRVVRNDEVSVDEIENEIKPDKIVISPGPGDPDAAGITLGTIERFAGRVPILGVCLGHQAIGQHFGGNVVRGPEPVHGKPVDVRHDGRTIFEGVPQDFAAARYHSLVVDRESVPDCLEISAESPDGLVMAVRHREMPVEGVQFHPESILTEHGKTLLRNFLESR
jgi:para-aminobenzoate synthetase component 2